MRNTRHWVVCGAVGLLMLPLAAVRADGQTIKNETARPIQSVEGVDTFKAYCAVCHGPDAKGNGPAAAALKKAPADLTTIAKRNGGTFSTTGVEAVIRGEQTSLSQTASASHGSRDMPIWGPVFQAFASDDAFAKLRVANLVSYLKSIQSQ